MIEIPRRRQTDRFERDLFVGAVEAVRSRIGTGRSLKEIVEGSVLLDDDDDVIDFSY
jgi:hypothetical protein